MSDDFYTGVLRSAYLALRCFQNPRLPGDLILAVPSDTRRAARFDACRILARTVAPTVWGIKDVPREVSVV